ncbi:hypothetical protein HELRODRAFT_107328 [Helobdella robusta]|uniref:ENTH domain-containing protein n=1 Tax=Helobdella robusta TaxID=6412 RepID=T1EE96_HELRO|nr:hypothetical protein HELRODRAFT_107328 [Helobdella robusta]ESN96150.1 hypothetical protein HELRODRAFT_107328 [Helobdella robusta]
MPIHRTIKNVVKNYTPAEVKVREATSNDPWGPATTLLNEIAELTHSSIALPEIMNMIWKRISDQGKNWRHVLKALNLLEYLSKVGAHQVAENCKSHIHTLQLLGEFQHFEEGKDYGASIREKSKQFVSLLRDNERFKNERSKALAAKERLAQSSGLGVARSTSNAPQLSSEFEAVRPSSFGEEDLQLQLALAMSKEEHEGEMKRRKEDEFKLQMALEESKKISSEVRWKDGWLQASSFLFSSPIKQLSPPSSSSSQQTSSSSFLPSSLTWDSNLHHTAAAPAALNLDPWSSPTSNNLSNNHQQQPASDPWGLPASDPWSSSSVANEDLLSGTVWSTGSSLADGSKDDQSKKKMKSVEDFLGENSNLVNLNDLISKPPPSTIANPFMMTSLNTRQATANQMAASLPTAAHGGGPSNIWSTPIGQVQPILPANQSQAFVLMQNYPQQNNPFL